MICRKCASIFDDSMSTCPDCGAPVFGDEKEISFEKEEDCTTDKEDAVQSVTENEDDAFEIPEYIKEKPVVITAKKANVRNERDFHIRVENVGSDAQKKASDVNRDEKKEKQDIGDKSAAILIVALVCVLSVMGVLLAAVGVRSDVFKKDDEVKTMVLSGLSGEETGRLEEWISSYGYAFCEEFEASHHSVAQVLEFIGVGNEKSLYTDMFGAIEKTEGVPDPAHRYKNEEGEYSYYRVEEAKIDSVLSLFSMESDPTLNCENAYYHNGFYYFSDRVNDLSVKSYVADVSSSKKIQDGSFYIKYHLLDADTFSDEVGDRYAIVEKLSADDNKWKVKKISREPVFDPLGNMIREDDYQMKTETVEISADNGTVYHKITVEYPVFSGTTNGEAIVNEMFVNTLANYRTMGKNTAGSDYEHYISNGGKAEELPVETRVTVKVTCANSSYIGFLMEIAEYVPASMPEKKPVAESEEEQEENVQPEQEQKDEPVELSQRRVEGYTIDVETGEFIGKDAVIGKDYQNISKLLYRIYGGYDYSDVVADIEKNMAATDENTEDSEREQRTDIPTDEKNLGDRIYNGAGALSDEGYVFCFINEKGYSETVVMPFEISSLFQGDFLKQEN